MSRTARWIILAPALVAGLGVGVLTAPAAQALSCVAHPDPAPESIASGTEQLATGEPFFALFDYAVVGTVTAVRTDERQGSPTYGATEIDVQVHGVLGTSTAPATTTLRAGDPGWMVGYPFAVGTSYFVPVQARSAEGIVNWTFGCDPVSEVGDPAAASERLGALAGDAGIPFATPSAESGTGDDAGSDGGIGWFVPAVSVTALAAAGGVLVVLRRRPTAPRGVDPLPVGHGDEGVERGGGTA